MRYRLFSMIFCLLLAACGGNEATQAPPTTVAPTAVANAEDVDPCPAMVQSALAQIGTICQSLERNQVCYGNRMISLDMQPDEGNTQFNAPGDVVSLSQIARLRLSEMNTSSEEWGVAVMLIQADLPDTIAGQNVTFLLYGDVQLDTEPNNRLNSFRIRTGFGDAPCNEAPESGVLIQTPDGVGEVQFTVNGVDIALGSTAYLQAVPEETMNISVVEGQAQVTSQGQTEQVAAGTRTQIELNEEGLAVSPPSPAEPYEEPELQRLPVQRLTRPVTIAPAPTRIAVQDAFELGQVIEAEINQAGDVQDFPFQVAAGQSVFFDTQDIIGDIRVSLIDPNGEVVPGINRIYFDDEAILETGGEYILRFAGSGEEVGTYSLKLWNIPPPDEFETAIGEISSGTIETPGVSDIYTFEAEPGQELFFDVQELEGDIRFSLVNAADEIIDGFNRIYFDDAVKLEAGGTYTLRVTGNTDATGTYTFQLWDAVRTDNGTIAIGDVVSGAVDTPGASTVYTLTVDSGQSLFFDIQELDGDIRFTLINHEGETVTGFDRIWFDDDFVIEEGGTYTLLVAGNGDKTGNYVFQLWDAPTIDQGVLPVGEVLSGTIDTPGAKVIYTLEIEESRSLFFDIQELEGDIRFTLFNSENETVDGFRNVWFDDDFALEEPGEYILEIGGNGDEIGSFTFQFWDVPPVEEVTTSIGNKHTGTIDTPGMKALYVFEVPAGQSLYLDVGELEGDMRFTLIDPEGETVSDLSNTWIDKDLILEIAGDYALFVNGDGDETGSYNFALLESAPEED